MYEDCKVNLDVPNGVIFCVIFDFLDVENELVAIAR
jgi:hypothetical protein